MPPGASGAGRERIAAQALSGRSHGTAPATTECEEVRVTCYMRHMDWLFDELAIPSHKKNRTRVDGALRTVLGLGAEAHCPEIWAALKALSEDERMDLVPGVAETLGK